MSVDVIKAGQDMVNFGSADCFGMVHRGAFLVRIRDDGWPCQPPKPAPPEPNFAASDIVASLAGWMGESLRQANGNHFTHAKHFGLPE